VTGWTLRATAWMAGLFATGVALRLVGSGDLAAPPLGSIGDLSSWTDAREPGTAAVALVRLAAEVGVWYVLAVSAIHAVSAALRTAGGHRLADALAVAGVRRLVYTGLGIGLAAASSVGGQEEASRAGTVTMTPVAESPVAAQTRVEDLGGTAAMHPRVAHPADGGAAQMAPGPPVWTVGPGESLWSIAEELLADAWHRAPSDAEVDPFWRALVERNRGRLLDPGDPDLIHPGQVFDVPPLPSPAG
jgi:hypothetical protein